MFTAFTHTRPHTTIFKDHLPLGLGEIKSACFSTNASIYLLLLGLIQTSTCLPKDHGILEQLSPSTACASTTWASAEG